MKTDQYTQAETPPQPRLRRVELNDAAAMKQVGALHMELLRQWGPMTALGERFVREACYAVNMRDDLLQVDLLEIEGRTAGFVAYTAQSLSFHRNALRAYWPRVAGELALALLSRPSRLLGLMRALGVVASRRAEADGRSDSLGEIVCIGVRPAYLAPKFVRDTGIRASELLIKQAAAYMQRTGVDRMRMLVDKPNRAALFLYHKLGAEFRDFQQAGAPMVEVTFELDRLLPESPVAMPALWRDSARVPESEASGWRRYWEQVAHNKTIFRHEADDYLERFFRHVTTSGRERILDFGCGYGFIAAAFAGRGHPVAVWDASSNARKQALGRLAGYPGVHYLNLESGGQCEAHKDAFDLITVHSVIQYMSDDELGVWLKRWRMMLAPGGRLLISDIITPAVGTVAELVSLLRLSVHKRFFLSAFWECVRETPNYWKTRNTLSLNVVEQPALIDRAAAEGFAARFLPENLSHRQQRLTVVLTKPGLAAG